MDLFDRVKRLIRDRGIESEISPNSSLTEDLGLDSLDVSFPLLKHVGFLSFKLRLRAGLQAAQLTEHAPC